MKQEDALLKVLSNYSIQALIKIPVVKEVLETHFYKEIESIESNKPTIINDDELFSNITEALKKMSDDELADYFQDLTALDARHMHTNYFDIEGERFFISRENLYKKIKRHIDDNLDADEICKEYSNLCFRKVTYSEPNNNWILHN